MTKMVVTPLTLDMNNSHTIPLTTPYTTTVPRSFPTCSPKAFPILPFPGATLRMLLRKGIAQVYGKGCNNGKNWTIKQQEEQISRLEKMLADSVSLQNSLESSLDFYKSQYLQRRGV